MMRVRKISAADYGRSIDWTKAPAVPLKVLSDEVKSGTVVCGPLGQQTYIADGAEAPESKGLLPNQAGWDLPDNDTFADVGNGA